MTHDPRQQVENLRDHLASNDKPLAFLIGAGASCAVLDEDGKHLIPDIRALGVLCDAAIDVLGEKYRDAYRTIEIDQAETLRRVPTIEDMLSSIRDKIAAMEPEDKLSGATRADLEEIERTLRTTIATAAMPDDARVPRVLPHHALAQWIARIDRKVPVELFTTNYDTLLERALEDERVATFDGFVGSRRPFFTNAGLTNHDAAPPKRWTRLWKIHGSINWHRSTDADKTLRITREGEDNGGELIYPSAHKYDESRMQPYLAMIEHLGRVLERPEETVLITIGYSFGDQHINRIIFDALDARERTHVISLQFGELPEDHEVCERAQRRHNLLVLGPRTAIIGGERAAWRLVEPVANQTAALLDVPFDSDAIPEGHDAALVGTFRLGDFNWFATFLRSIASADARRRVAP